MGEGGIDQMCIVISASLIEPYLIVVLICILASGNHSCIVFRIIVKIHNIGIKCSSSCRVSSFDDSLKEVIKLVSDTGGGAVVIGKPPL